MSKIGTKPFNLMRQIKNLNAQGGLTANKMAKKMKAEGYTEIYQRRWQGEGIVLSGKNAEGNTKTQILNMFGFRTKTNTTKTVSPNTKVKEIDKSNSNEFGREIFGETKKLTFVNNNLVKTENTKRGWNA